MAKGKGSGVVLGYLKYVLGFDSLAFEQGLGDVDKRLKAASKSWMKQAEGVRSLGVKMSLGVTAPLAGLAAGFADAARDIAASVPDLERSAQLANTTTTEFQRMAFAAKSVGIESDKLGDIYKDVNDKVGDFIATGGGEMKDFFENIAPKVGLTAQQFQKLSGPDALQAYYTALERAGVSHAEMTFYMESIADEASALAPLLRDNGKAMDELGAKAAVVSPQDIQQFKAYTEATRQMDQAFQRLTIAIVSSGLLDRLTSIVTKVAEFVANLSKSNPKLLEFGLLAGTAASALGPLLITTSSLMQLLTPLAARMAVAGTASAVAGTAAGTGAVGFGALSVSLLPIAAIAAAVGAAGYLIYQNWDKIAPVLEAAGTAIAEAAGPAVREMVEALKQAFTELWNGPFGTAMREVIRVIGEFHAIYVSVFGKVLVEVIKLAAQAVSGSIQVIADVIKMIARLLKGDWAGAFEAAKSIVYRSFGGLPEWVVGQVRRMVDGIKPQLERMGAIMRAALNPIEAVRLGFYKLYDAVVGHSYVPDMVDGIGAHMRRLDAEMVRPATAATSKVDEAFRTLAAAVRPILDRLFPEQARTNQFLQELADLEAGMKAMGATAEQTAEAVARLKDEYFKDTGRTEMMTGADVVRNAPGGLEIETGDIYGELGQISEKTKAEWAKVTGANDNLKASFAEMARDVSGSLQGLVTNLKSGDWLGALGGVLDLVGQISGMIRGTGQPATRTYGVGGFGGFRADGGPVRSGMTYMVGERGPELFTARRSGYISPNAANDGPGAPAVIQIVADEGGMFVPRVQSISGDVSVQTISASNAAMARMQRRRLGRGG